jgi:hypothetical protein
MQEIQTRLEEAIRLRDFAGLRDAMEGLPPLELAQLIGEAPGEQQATVFRVLPRATAAATFEYLSHDKQEELLKSLARGDSSGCKEKEDGAIVCWFSTVIITINVSVTDGNNRPITDLGVEEFGITEDNVKQEIVFLDCDDSSVSFGDGPQ